MYARIAGGALPAGLSLVPVPTGCFISGKVDPLADLGEYPILIEAWDDDVDADIGEFSLTVRAPRRRATFLTGSGLGEVVAGLPVSIQINVGVVTEGQPGWGDAEPEPPPPPGGTPPPPEP